MTDGFTFHERQTKPTLEVMQMKISTAGEACVLKVDSPRNQNLVDLPDNICHVSETLLFPRCNVSG